MRFFIDPTPFTHRARLYGFPCYFKDDGPDGCELAGTNLFFDWCLLMVVPWLHWLCERIRWVMDPVNYEPGDWPIELRGELHA